MELSKYIKSESVELNRSAIHFADYNPRKLSDESRKTLKRGIKKFGLVGGIVVNKRTGLTVVSRAPAFVCHGRIAKVSR